MIGIASSLIVQVSAAALPSLCFVLTNGCVHGYLPGDSATAMCTCGAAGHLIDDASPYLPVVLQVTFGEGLSMFCHRTINNGSS